MSLSLPTQNEDGPHCGWSRGSTERAGACRGQSAAPRAVYLVLQSHSSSFPAALPICEDLGNPSPSSNPRGFQRLTIGAACSAGRLGLWPQGFHQEMSEQEVASTRPVLSNLYLQARGQRPTVVNTGLTVLKRF